MASGDLDPSKYADLSREYAELSPIVEKAQEMKSTQSELSDLEELLSDGDTDAEMKELAELEREELKGRLPDLEEALRILLLPKDAADEKSAILKLPVPAATRPRFRGRFDADVSTLCGSPWLARRILGPERNRVGRGQGSGDLDRGSRRLRKAKIRVGCPSGTAGTDDGERRADSHLTPPSPPAGGGGGRYRSRSR